MRKRKALVPILIFVATLINSQPTDRELINELIDISTTLRSGLTTLTSGLNKVEAGQAKSEAGLTKVEAASELLKTGLTDLTDSFQDYRTNIDETVSTYENRIADLEHAATWNRVGTIAAGVVAVLAIIFSLGK